MTHVDILEKYHEHNFTAALCFWRVCYGNPHEFLLIAWERAHLHSIDILLYKAIDNALEAAGEIVSLDKIILTFIDRNYYLRSFP